MDEFRMGQLATQRFDQKTGEHCHPAFSAFSVAHKMIAAIEVDIFHPQSQTLHQSQAATLEHARREPMHAVEMRQYCRNFRPNLNHRQALGPLFHLKAVDPRQIDGQDFSVQKQQGAQRLILRTRRYVTASHEMGQIPCDLLCTHIPRIALSVKQDEPANPLNLDL